MYDLLKTELYKTMQDLNEWLVSKQNEVSVHLLRELNKMQVHLKKSETNILSLEKAPKTLNSKSLFFMKYI